MYDYVVQFMFDKETTEKIEKIKGILRNANIVNTERPWDPHITIDLYKGIDIKDLDIRIKEFIDNFTKINIKFNELGRFNKRVLFLKPSNEKEIFSIRECFDDNFNNYRIKEAKSFIPHASLTINDDITEAEDLINEHFKPFEGTIDRVSIFDIDMNLIKEYYLK